MLVSQIQSAPYQANEADLWNLFREGNKTAFDRIFDLYISQLQWYGYAICKDKNLVDDCIQELFIELWVKRAKLSATTSIKFYLLHSIRRRIMRRLKSEHWYSKILPVGEFNIKEVVACKEDQIIADETDGQNTLWLKQMVAKLSKRQQEIIYLRYTEMLSIDQISETMNLSVKSVYSLIAKGIAALRKSVKGQ